MARQTADEGQPSTRRFGKVTDQHGRQWSTYIDNRSGLPLGPFQPIGWSAPWEPPQGAKIFVCNEDNPTQVTINYQHLLDEREVAQREVEESRKAAAAARGWDHLDPEKQDLLDKVAQPRGRTNAPEIIVACMQGNRWILGFTDVVDERVKKYLPVKASAAARLGKYEDFSDSLADDLEARMDLQEKFQPDSEPRDRAPIKPTKKPKAPSGVAA